MNNEQDLQVRDDQPLSLRAVVHCTGMTGDWQRQDLAQERRDAQSPNPMQF